MCLEELIMVEGKIGGAQGGGVVEVLAQALEEAGERLAKEFRTLTCLNHCQNVQAKEVAHISVGPLVAEVVVGEVGAGLVTLDRHTFLIPMVQTSPSISKLVLQSQTSESHAGLSLLLSKFSLTI